MLVTLINSNATIVGILYSNGVKNSAAAKSPEIMAMIKNLFLHAFISSLQKYMRINPLRIPKRIILRYVISCNIPFLSNVYF